MSTTAVDLEGLGRLHGDLTSEYLDHAGVLPLRVQEGRLELGAWRPVDQAVLDDLAILFDADPVVVDVTESEGRQAVRRLYGTDAMTAEAVIAGMSAGPAGDVLAFTALDDLVALANEAPVVKLVNLLLLEALEARASDVHLETYALGLRVRYRVDGVLQEAPAPPPALTAAVVSRLKIMAELDIAERRLPQDGRIRLRLQDRQVDVRVSTLPSLHGESVVLRLLDKEQGTLGLEELGMAGVTLSRFLEVLERPHGIVLATGPTGSGKTTTLYAAVERLRTGREKILTVEDPVEYELSGVPQVPVNEKVGVTFATALRALLRQDPDVMLVGEIRDPETAEIATHAALTGHLVLSTLHTNDAPSALTRLIDLGVPAYLVASTVEAVLAQRLVRKVCGHCREIAPMSPATALALGVGAGSSATMTIGRGCPGCRGTGYRGRVGVYELLVMSDGLRAALLVSPESAALRARAREEGMLMLRDDGLRLIQDGITTAEEVLRVTRA
jgi:general secretion pathway protein E